MYASTAHREVYPDVWKGRSQDLAKGGSVTITRIVTVHDHDRDCEHGRDRDPEHSKLGRQLRRSRWRPSPIVAFIESGADAVTPKMLQF